MNVHTAVDVDIPALNLAGATRAETAVNQPIIAGGLADCDLTPKRPKLPVEVAVRSGHMLKSISQSTHRVRIFRLRLSSV